MEVHPGLQLDCTLRAGKMQPVVGERGLLAFLLAGRFEGKNVSSTGGPYPGSFFRKEVRITWRFPKIWATFWESLQ